MNVVLTAKVLTECKTNSTTEENGSVYVGDVGTGVVTMSEYCAGCGKDMWEYPDEADWCITCAPECYGPGGTYRG